MMTFWLSASSNSNLMRFHTMENVSAFPTATKQRIPTTLSAASLEVGQIIAANFVQNSSLLSESVTHVSDLSSTFSEVLPAFPMCSLPDVATVSLGEHLKMFPGTPTTTNSCILLASPTAPRLQSMCKECLSISKWAEYSMGWSAPGHIPWENTLECTTQKWVPEGSLFSSESFSRALFHARNRCTAGVLSDSPRPNKMEDVNSEMLEMMRELHSLRSYFAETLPDDPDLDLELDCHRPPVPALVVSTSYITLPLASLESSQNLSQYSTSAIASPQIKSALPSLTSRKENIPFTISEYPEFLGSCASASLDDQPTIIMEKSTLRVEDMITNLRFQCSSMSPTLPVDDTSWNSTLPTSLASDNEPEPNHSNLVDKQPSKSLMDSGPVKAPKPSPPSNIGYSALRLRGKINQSIYKQRISSNLTSSQGPTRKPNKSILAPNIASPPTRVIVQKNLPSAMAKSIGNRSQRPYKVVRFVLPKSEVEEDLVGITPKSSSNRQPLSTNNVNKGRNSQLIIFPDNIRKTVPISPPTRLNSISVRKGNGGVVISGPSALKDSRTRTRSLSITTPFRKNVIPPESAEVKVSTKESGITTTARRSHSTGAQSLRRIIRGPMLALKENKRATIHSTAFNTTSDADEMCADVQGNSKKNRMPIQIKSLLTRFK